MTQRRLLLVLACAMLAALDAGAQGIRIAVMDFELQSDDPRFKYLGKGFAELTAVEVGHIPGVVLVDRDRRNALLEEQEFSLSGAADESSAVAIGKLLSVNYIVSGTIVDMLGGLVVSYEVLRTDTGEIVGKEKTEGAPSEYKRMVTDIGRGIAAMTGTIIASARPSAAGPSPGTQAAVLSSFSEAVAALDTKDIPTAKAKLEEARALDPTDPAVRYYLDKLAGGGSKFAVIPEPYYSLDNPATLAFRDKDMAYTYVAFGGTYLTGGAWPNDHPPDSSPGTVELNNLYGSSGGGTGPAGRYGDRELDGTVFVGYTTPIGASLGLGAQAFFSHREYDLVRMGGPMAPLSDPNQSSPLPALYQPAADSNDFSGGVLSLGWAPSRGIAIGVSATFGTYSGWVGDYTNGGMGNSIAPGTFEAGELGLLLRDRDGSLVYSLSGGASNYRTNTFNSDSITIGTPTEFSAFVDTSIAWSFDRLRDFLVLKGMADIYGFQAGSSPSYFQVLPAVEHWFGRALSLRLGADVTFVADAALETGLGGTVGMTLVLGGWEIDLGGTYRMQPSHVVDDELIPVTVFSIGIRRNGIFTR
jgi:TolB-like protein